MSRGIFTGLCYVCGVRCGRTYCHEHKHLAVFMAMPYRKDIGPGPTLEEFDSLLKQSLEQQRRLDAWRRVHGVDRKAA